MAQSEKLTNVQTSRENDKENLEQDIIQQTASLVKRNKNIYTKAVEVAGLKICSKFKLSLESVQKIKAEVPWTVWRLIKGVVTKETGVHIFGSEKGLRQNLKTQEFEYECGTYISKPDKSGTVHKVPFLRVLNVAEVIKKTAFGYDKGSWISLANVPRNTLYIIFAGKLVSGRIINRFCLLKHHYDI